MKKEYSEPNAIITECSADEDIMTTSKGGLDIFSGDNYDIGG